MGAHGYSERPALKSSLKDLDHLIGIKDAAIRRLGAETLHNGRKRYILIGREASHLAPCRIGQARRLSLSQGVRGGVTTRSPRSWLSDDRETHG